MAAVEYILGLPLGNGTMDNVDSLENRHLRGIGEVLTQSSASGTGADGSLDSHALGIE